MARPMKCRRICDAPGFSCFGPAVNTGEKISDSGAADTGKQPAARAEAKEVYLTLDEFEAIRLIDLENLTQAQCAAQMEISRTTAAEIYASARVKIADCLVNGKALRITGGNYRICDGSAQPCCLGTCRRFPQKRAVSRQTAQKPMEQWKEKQKMRIAVTYDNGTVFQHFGHTEAFKIYDTENGKIISATVVPTEGCGHGALAGFLADHGVGLLICGGIGGGARAALAESGIRVLGGISGSADAAVQSFLDGTLSYDPDAGCSNPEHGGHCGSSCEESGKCGSHGC